MSDQTTGLSTQGTDFRAGMDVKSIQQTILDQLYYMQAKVPAIASQNDWYMAIAYAVRDRLVNHWMRAANTLIKQQSKVVAYFSAEFLMGPHLGNAIINLGIEKEIAQAIENLGLDLNKILAQEEEPGLGNGGLGRLAACYLDSLATLEIPAIGYGIRYEFGIFDQEIRDGWQVEVTDKWLGMGNPWEIPHPEIAYSVNFGGRTETYTDERGNFRVRWIPSRVVRGIANDTPVPGYRVPTIALLRLWKAEAVESFDFEAFNVGDYYGAVEEKMFSENISKILYPNDEALQGKELRLEQQYFFVSCSLQDMFRMHLRSTSDLRLLPEKYAVQLNDTHPSIAVAELMRLLVDVHGLDWDTSWEITQTMTAYTNHTLLPEALEKWPLSMFGKMLPRHLEIIYEINKRFLERVKQKFPGDDTRVARMSLIDETGERYVRMAHLASEGSHKINGVAELHSELLRKDVLRDFYEFSPEKFTNVTNGVTPRRWLVLSNPGLAKLITQEIGEGWACRLDKLRELERSAKNREFCNAWRKIKKENKVRLANLIQERTGISVDPDSLFDIQVKRLHEYKRQHLNALHIITLYYRLKSNPRLEITPRTFLFGGKAAPGYFMAKRIIKLINSIAEVVNHDPDVNGRLKVVFFPDFNVKNGHFVYPAADLSEQISTAGKEASGTGNMKFAMNGALTIGTLDGANVEIREEAGADNFFLFGLTTEEVYRMKSSGYNPRGYYDSNAGLRHVLDSLVSGDFSRGDRELFRPLFDSLLNHDDYLLLADYQSYVDCQDRVGSAYRNQDQWTYMSIMNVARMGKFSSDRSIREYADKIWNAKSLNL
ncbi:MAG: glycogen phosphorylase [Acidobacteria bacterium]|nr:MAG: glycogen phosphorylase [Acidobacteriota bacterium]